jgi:branched-chain amino acid transport system permease protein
MSTATAQPADRQLICLQRFNTRLESELRTLITEDLIDEYRRQPLGRHSDALERVLNWIRKAPAFALYSRVPCREWQVIRLPVRPGAGPEPVDDAVYTDENEALHAVFLRHIERLKASGG